MNKYVFGVGDVVDEYVNSVVCVWEEGRGALMSQGFMVKVTYFTYKLEAMK